MNDAKFKKIAYRAFDMPRSMDARYIEIAPDTNPAIRDRDVFDAEIDKAMIDIDSVLIKATAKHAEFNAGLLIPSLNIMRETIRLLGLKTLRDPEKAMKEQEIFLFGMHRTGVDYLEQIASEADDPQSFAAKYKKLIAVRALVKKTQNGHAVCVYIVNATRKIRSALGIKAKNAT